MKSTTIPHIPRLHIIGVTRARNAVNRNVRDVRDGLDIDMLRPDRMSNADAGAAVQAVPEQKPKRRTTMTDKTPKSLTVADCNHFAELKARNFDTLTVAAAAAPAAAKLEELIETVRSLGQGLRRHSRTWALVIALG